MFSVTCAQKVAKINTLPSELEAWEQRRKEESSKIQDRRRRHERSSKAIFPRGYGPAGRVPKYVEAHIGSLEESPLARPVFSPGRCVRPSACRRRPQSAAAATTGTMHNTQPKRAAVNTRPKTANDRRIPKEQRHQQKKKVPSASSSPLLLDRPTRGAATSRATLDAGGRVRPATAPCESSRKDFSACLQNGDGARDEETRLVEKMARLTGGRKVGKFPTVAALKTAVALHALQAQLRELRASNSDLRTKRTPAVGGGGGDGADQKRAVSAPVSRNPAAAGGTPAAPRDRSTSARWRRRGREHQRELKPWDNRSPFLADNMSPSRSTGAPGTPTSPAIPVLRTLTRHDPVFGCVSAAAAVASSAPPPPAQSLFTPNNNNLGERSASSPSATSTPVAQETQVQACFRRLTVGALVELSHLRNPPKPVLAVLAGLGCLLGWKQDKRRGRSSKQADLRHHHHHHHHHPPRSLFSNVYVLRDVLASVCPRRIPSRRLAAIVTRLGVPEAAPEKVRSANAAAWVLLEWLLSVVACARPGGDSGT